MLGMQCLFVEWLAVIPPDALLKVPFFDALLDSQCFSTNIGSKFLKKQLTWNY